MLSSAGEPQSLDFLLQALQEQQQANDKQTAATTLNKIGLAYLSANDYNRALDFFQQSLALHQELGNKYGEAATLNNIGQTYFALGKTKSINYYSQALSVYQELDDKRGQAVALNNTGRVYQEMQDFEEALAYFEESVPLRHAAGDTFGEANTLLNIAGIYHYDLEEPEMALDSYLQAISLFQQINDISSEANALANTAWVYSALGQRQTALGYLEKAIPLYESLNNHTEVERFNQTLADWRTALEKQNK